MGCGCRKTQTTEQRDAARRAAATNAGNPMMRDPATPAAPPRPSAPQGQTQTFALETPSGSFGPFGSYLEADAARVRAGGGIVRPL